MCTGPCSFSSPHMWSNTWEGKGNNRTQSEAISIHVVRMTKLANYSVYPISVPDWTDHLSMARVTLLRSLQLIFQHTYDTITFALATYLAREGR